MITGIIGGMSSGKTLVQTYFLWIDHFEKNKNIYSNYKLMFPHQIILTKDITEYAKQKKNMDNVSIGLDEIYLYIDSRLSGAKSNRIYSYFALQTSKRDVNLYYTTQNFHAVDKRIRDNTHCIISCYPLIIKDKDHVEPIINRENRLLTPEELKYFYILIIKTYRITVGFKTMVKSVPELIKVVSEKRNLVEMYNTKEIISFGD